jgi:sugar lactone lactonase YvrE
MTTIDLPVSCPTSAASGRDGLSTMLVTTSRHKLEAQQRAKEHLAGAILTIDAGVTGRAGNPVSPGVAARIPSSTRQDGA